MLKLAIYNQKADFLYSLYNHYLFIKKKGDKIMVNTTNNYASLSVEVLTAKMSAIDKKIAELKAEKAEIKKSPAFHEAYRAIKNAERKEFYKSAKFGERVAELLKKGDFEAIKKLTV